MSCKINRFGLAFIVLALAIYRVAADETPPDSKASAEKPAAEKPAEKPAEKSTEKPGEKPAAEKPAGEKPATHKVSPGPLRVEAAVDGVFEATHAEELALRPESWAQFKILKAVEHGATVKKGEQLVWLDMHEIDDAVKDQEVSDQLAGFSAQLEREELQILEKLFPHDLTQAERTRKNAEDDLQSFLKVLRPFDERAAEQSLKMADQFVEYAAEELRQLEKMYKADDLTEETEEIILKRARNDLEQTKFFAERMKVFIDLQVKHLPREQAQLEDQARTQEYALQRAKTTLPLNLAKARLALEKSKHDQERSKDRLTKLRQDRAAMKIVAPCDGVVYYGQCVRGHWATAATKYNPGDNLPAHAVFMTVVKPRPLSVRINVAEKELHQLKPGVEGRAVPAGYPDLRIPAKLSSISKIPVAAGSFDGTATITLPDSAATITAGMACKVNFTAYHKTDALTIPPGALFSEELDPDQHYVYVSPKEGKPEKRNVQVGQKTEKKVEIVSGLKEGEEILLEDPTLKSK